MRAGNVGAELFVFSVGLALGLLPFVALWSHRPSDVEQFLALLLTVAAAIFSGPLSLLLTALFGLTTLLSVIAAPFGILKLVRRFLSRANLDHPVWECSMTLAFFLGFFLGSWWLWVPQLT